MNQRSEDCEKCGGYRNYSTDSFGNETLDASCICGQIKPTNEFRRKLDEFLKMIEAEKIKNGLLEKRNIR
jgi:hypothetical protein